MSAAAPSTPQVPTGVSAGYVVFDRQTGKITSHRNAHRKFRSASAVKILIAIDYLESHKSVSTGDLALLKTMLRVSDDDAATSFWNRGGQGKIIERVARKLRLTDTAPPPSGWPGFWGYTSISALDIAKTYRYLLDRAAPRVSDLILGHLRKAEQCGSDGFDQYFGIPRGVRGPWAVKQGWSGYGSTPPSRCRRTTVLKTTSDTAALPATPAVTTASLSHTAGLPAAPAVTTAELSRTAELPATPAAASARVTPAAVHPVPDFGRPVLHTTGLVGPKERWIMVLLTAHPSTTTWQRSTGQVTKLAREVHLSGTS
ncbi:hypothetical protein ACFQX6_18470 [Streptosporangium lutulentum]